MTEKERLEYAYPHPLPRKAMTEDQIERAVEKKCDWIDGLLISGQIDQQNYDARVRAIDRWADNECRFRDRTEDN